MKTETQIADDFNITKKDKKDFRKFAEKAKFIIKYFFYGAITGSVILLIAFIRSWLK